MNECQGGIGTKLSNPVPGGGPLLQAKIDLVPGY